MEAWEREDEKIRFRFLMKLSVPQICLDCPRSHPIRIPGTGCYWSKWDEKDPKDNCGDNEASSHLQFFTAPSDPWIPRATTIQHTEIQKVSIRKFGSLVPALVCLGYCDGLIYFASTLARLVFPRLLLLEGTSPSHQPNRIAIRRKIGGLDLKMTMFKQFEAGAFSHCGACFRGLCPQILALAGCTIARVTQTHSPGAHCKISLAPKSSQEITEISNFKQYRFSNLWSS